MTFYIQSPSHWLLCEIVSRIGSRVRFHLHDDLRIMSGRARDGIKGFVLVEAI
jgi:hypothetical protein